MRDQCLAYLKEKFLTDTNPRNQLPPTREEREPIWDEVPQDVKDHLIDLVLGFSSGSPAYAEIKAEYDKKSHSDMSFGMTVKQIISKHK